MEDLQRKATVILRGMWTHRRLALLVAWSVGLLAFAGAALVPEKYEASARLFVNTDSILKPLMTGLAVQPNDDQRIAMLSRVVINRPNVEKIVQASGFDARTSEQREAAIDGVLRTLQLRGGGKDNIFTLTYRDANPTRARAIVEQLASLFMDSSKGRKTEDTESAKRFLDEQIAVYEKKLEEAEGRLKEFRVRNLGIAPNEGKDFFVRISETEGLLRQSRLELREAETARDALRRGLAGSESPVSIATGASNDATSSLVEVDARIDTMQRNLDALLLKYTENHPDIVGARRILADLKQQRAELAARIRSMPAPQSAPTGQRASETLKVSLAQAEASVASLSARVAEYSSRYERLRSSAALVPQLEAELAQLNRDYEIHKKNYDGLVSRRESATMSGEMQSVAGVSDFRLVDPPRVSPRPVAPNHMMLIPLALLASLVAGLAAAFLAMRARPTFFDARTLREATGLPLLGTLSQRELAGDNSKMRRAFYRYGGAVGALVVFYGAGLVALEALLAPAR